MVHKVVGTLQFVRSIKRATQEKKVFSLTSVYNLKINVLLVVQYLIIIKRMVVIKTLSHKFHFSLHIFNPKIYIVI